MYAVIAMQSSVKQTVGGASVALWMVPNRLRQRLTRGWVAEPKRDPPLPLATRRNCE